MEEQLKGTVTPLASLFPVDEAQKAVQRVQEAISEKEKELDRLKGFIADNTNLVNLVQRLPDELHHDIMVPFGKAAFFPGRLVHTNEFMVLLGEGYYTERTAKQTVEILKRREKMLDSQVDSLKANVHDLKAEASFFDTTVAEAAEGLVEIREDYVEESSIAEQSELDGTKDEDEEYKRMMSRLDELEKEELAAEGEQTDASDSDDESGEDDHLTTTESENETYDDEQALAVDGDNQSSEYKQTKPNSDENSNQTYRNRKVRFSEESLTKQPQQPKFTNTTANVLSDEVQSQIDFSKNSNCTGLAGQLASTDEKSSSKSLAHKHSISAEKSSMLPEVKEKVEALSLSRNEVPAQLSKSGFDSRKAFTGSIVEHNHNLQVNTQEQSSSSSQTAGSEPSKPVSRFKMQRR
ncbi:RNA polymerase II subunit 5-mediating protein homolog isoform X1 [Tripterygium wilfordii]|uniref:RNA polymerase II subunit 5-mediating protein homolog isoform X1 n=1 Tax=Tripterygium wilfordii TaxID=458696 RepID=UPI0018F85E27|nr:RNA polymerase II subunit 5-mediating protein homolog isoform X1 [Tripterygium wilfordii]